MIKRLIMILLTASMVLGLLSGCTGRDAADVVGGRQTEGAEVNPETEPTVPPMTTPPDGSPKDVTCKGSYTGSVSSGQVVAHVGDAELTNGTLQAFYWAQVAQGRDQLMENGPDFDLPLDQQVCLLDGSVGSWQQYFLRQALNSWHTAQALAIQGQEEGVPLEEAFKPDPEKHAEYMSDMPANRLLYGFYDHYVPNSMHQAYLDNISEALDQAAADAGYASAGAMAEEAFGTAEKDLTDAARLYNLAYMYYTTLGYDIAPEDETVEAYANEAALPEGGYRVNVRHILLHPQQPENPWRQPEDVETAQVDASGVVTCSDQLWEQGAQIAQKLLDGWKTDRRVNESTFADLAHQRSADAGTALDGGLYQNIAQGQLLEPLDAWCFDPARQPGDTTILRTQYGFHILYFSGRVDARLDQAREALTAQAQEQLLLDAREKYPMKVDYPSITLGEGRGDVSFDQILYPDVAHERFPEAPLYVQQDYPDTMYGAFPIRSHGCGITTMAMLASYMSDKAQTPPIMCERYASYCHVNGTDGMLFNYAPAEMGFYLIKKTYDAREAKQALADGYVLVCAQTAGYWTRGGHYLLLESMDEEEMVQVRDSNLFNYGRLENHKNDKFPWSVIPPKCVGYWIFANKVTRIPACSRCGSTEGLYTDLILPGYLCEKCRPALLRRDTYLNNCGK